MSSFWGRFTASIAGVRDTIEDTKEAYYKQQRIQWVDEVVDPETQRFGHFKEWQRRYEPDADDDEKDGGGGGEEPGALQVRMLNYMSTEIRDNILHVLLKMVSKLLGPAEESVNAADEDLGAFLNAANGVVLTFRYQYLDKDKFAYVRAYAAEQVALSLGRAVQREQERLGHAAGADLSAEQMAEVTGAVTERILKEIKDKEEEAHASLDSNPMLAAAAGADERASQGIDQLKGFLRGYVKDKTAAMQDTIRVVVERMLLRVAQSSAVISRHAKAAAAAKAGASAAKEGGEGGGGEEDAPIQRSRSLIAVADGPEPLSSDDEFSKVRQEIVDEVEEAHEKLSGEVQKYVTGLVFMLVGAKPEDQARARDAAEEDKAADKADADAAAE